MNTKMTRIAAAVIFGTGLTLCPFAAPETQHKGDEAKQRINAAPKGEIAKERINRPVGQV